MAVAPVPVQESFQIALTFTHLRCAVILSRPEGRGTGSLMQLEGPGLEGVCERVVDGVTLASVVALGHIGRSDRLLVRWVEVENFLEFLGRLIGFPFDKKRYTPVEPGVEYAAVDVLHGGMVLLQPVKLLQRRRV